MTAASEALSRARWPVASIALAHPPLDLLRGPLRSGTRPGKSLCASLASE